MTGETQDMEWDVREWNGMDGVFKPGDDRPIAVFQEVGPAFAYKDFEVICNLDFPEFVRGGIKFQVELIEETFGRTPAPDGPEWVIRDWNGMHGVFEPGADKPIAAFRDSEAASAYKDFEETCSINFSSFAHAGVHQYQLLKKASKEK